MIRRIALVLCASLALAGTSFAKGGKTKAPPPPPPVQDRGPNELVHVPTAEMDVLLRADSKGIVLRYEEYERLLAAARARALALKAQPPVDGTLVAASGTLDLTAERAGRLRMTYNVEVLAEGPRSVDFPLRRIALESILIQDTEGAADGRYEEWKRGPRLRFESPGRRIVTVEGSAAFARKMEQRYLDLVLPPASAMAVTLKFPAGVEGVVIGEGAPVEVRASADGPAETTVRPGRQGRLRIAFAPAAKGADDGPPIIDTRTNSLHTIGDGLVASRIIVNADVFRSPVSDLTLDVPADLAVRSLEGKGVTGFQRLQSGAIRVQLEKAFRGTVTMVLDAERPYRPAAAVAMPHITVQGAVRHRAEMSMRFGRDVRVRGITPTAGRRLPASRAKGQQDLLRYALHRQDATLAVDLEAGEVRTDAVSSYYLNLAEAGKTLIVTTTYRVLEGTVFALAPKMPAAYELRTVTVNGKPNGFTRDLRPDGTLEIALARGIPEGGEISLAATLEQSQADWVPDGAPVAVPFAVPSAGATREEGLVGIGADAAFRVLQSDGISDLVPVGAAELMARGISATGLVYGYRLDGTKPAVTLEVTRHEPLIEARIITTLLPSPRRLNVLSVIGHHIRRAGVRTLLVDVPAWAIEDQVRFDSPFVRGASMLKGDARPEDVPAGYERWAVDLNQRVIGRHATVVRYGEDQSEENWKIANDRVLGTRVPLERSERFLVVQRAEGLEVRTQVAAERGIQPVELTDLPPEAAVEPQQVLEILRLANGADGLGLSVRKHGGAAVLDAVATRVALDTAVAREGILRTRAVVRLFNVDRQFLEMALPRGSDLIGAVVGREVVSRGKRIVVDREPVKALSSPEGVLLIPIPTARRRSELVVAWLTYETHLDEEVGGSVHVHAPVFPNLEVLRTVQRVAFDPDFEIEDVGGDYGKVSAHEPRGRTPFLFDILGGLQPGVDSATPWDPRMTTADIHTPRADHRSKNDPAEFAKRVFEGPASNAASYEAETGADADLAASIVDAPFAKDEAQQTLRDSYDRSRLPHTARERSLDQLDQSLRRTRQLNEALKREQSRLLRKADDKPGRARVPEKSPRMPSGGVPPNLREPSDPTPTPPVPAGATTPAPALQPAPDEPPAGEMPALPGAADEGGGAGPPGDHEHHEGDMPSVQRGSGARGRARRKGLLSLDVPVVLGPNVVVAQRLGGGGALEIRLATEERNDDHFGLICLAFVGIALLAGAGSWVRKLAVIGGGAALAGLVAALFGAMGATFVVALVDALTIAVFLWLVAAVVMGVIRWTARIGARRPAPTTSAAALVIALLLGSAPDARADEPRPPVPDVTPPKKVFVPYDPADPTSVKPSDRVFLPLETYLKLYKAANPESDPELVKLGRMVTLVRARYTLDVSRDESAMATGVAEYRFAKRGTGQVLVAWPLGGLAVHEASLDGKPVRLLLDKGVYRIAVAEEGDHTLELKFRVPLVDRPQGRYLAFLVEPFAGAELTVKAPGFDGDVRVSGAGRVERGTADDFRAWLGHARRVSVALLERSPDELPTTVRTRVESRALHSLRDAGTESQVDATVYVLQGRAPFVDIALPDGVTVLEAGGPKVVRWVTLASPTPRVRMVFANPASGAVKIALRTFRASTQPARTETLPALAVLDTTGESGRVAVNVDPSMRVDVLDSSNLFRLGLPRYKGVRGRDNKGRVVGGWRFATRPTQLDVRTRRIQPRVDLDSVVSVVFGDDRVRTTFDGRVHVEARAPVGTLIFDLPGLDEVRRVESPGMDTWWLEGDGESRRLHVRYGDMRTGALRVRVRLTRRLGGLRDGISVPRWQLRQARRDRGRLFVFTLPDVDQKLGSVAGLRSLPLAGLRIPNPGIEGARPVNAYAWDRPIAESLPAGLRKPELETEAVVVSLVAPGDEEHRVDHLILFEVRRGSTDRVRFFVPDGDAGEGRSDVVTTRDLREMRKERVTRTDADGLDVSGTLYDLLLQSPQDGVIEVTVSQAWRARETSGVAGGVGAVRPLRVLRPEAVATTHWFSLVRTFLDGDVTVAPLAGKPDAAAWEDLPLVPTGIVGSDVLNSYVSRKPYALAVTAKRHTLEKQATAVVQAAVARVVVGMDGWARVRLDYRIFNRARQFLRLRLPEGATLYGATANGRPVKPLAGAEKSVLIAVPKVPLGGKGFPVSLLYRTRAGEGLRESGTMRVLLPEVVGVEVDRTVVQLYVPDGFDYDFDSTMTSTTPEDVAADLAEVAVREAMDLLKLAEEGTLSQRWAAAVNGISLIEHAQTKLLEVPGSPRKHAGLAGQLERLGEQFGERSKRIKADVAAAQRSQSTVNPTQDEFASNARNIVALDDVTNGLGQATGSADAVAGKNKAGWVVNPAQSTGKSAKTKSLEDLKKRIGTEFRRRAAREQRKNFRNFATPQGSKAGPQKKQAQQEQQDGAAFDAKQVQWLNDQLKQEQIRNRQLGAVDKSVLNRFPALVTPKQRADELIGYAEIYNSRFVGGDLAIKLNRGLQTLGDQPQLGALFITQGGQGGPWDGPSSGGGGGGHTGLGSNRQPAGIGSGADAGIFYNDDSDGDFRARTENVFGQELGLALQNEGRPVQPMPAGKVGLMGVDVDLPKVGKVYYFRSLRAGAPIEIKASSDSISVGSRVVVLLLILGAAFLVAMGIRRHRVAAAAA